MARRFRESRGRHGGGPGRTPPRSTTHPQHDPRARGSLDTRAAGSVRPDRDPQPADPPPGLRGDAAAELGHTAPVHAPPPQFPVEDRGHDPSGEAAAGLAVATTGDPPASRERLDRPGPTTAQLRRFIKSRPYVPMHELRRRFGLNGHDDDVVRLELDDQEVWVGLPADAGRMLADLIRHGEIGCELSVDPASPVVVGVFPMRPVARS